jgi:PAS domain-containing protein
VLYVLRASDAISRLRIADAQHRAVLAAIPDTFFRMNREAIISTTNRATKPARAFHRRVGSHIRDVLPPEIAAPCWTRPTPCWPRSTSARSTTLTGDSTRHFEARLVATGADEVLGLVRDISERKRTKSRSAASPIATA